MAEMKRVMLRLGFALDANITFMRESERVSWDTWRWNGGWRTVNRLIVGRSAGTVEDVMQVGMTMFAANAVDTVLGAGSAATERRRLRAGRIRAAPGEL